MTQANDILEHALKHRDFAALAVYADMIEEHGDPLAKGWRAVATRQAWPWQSPIFDDSDDTAADWWWWGQPYCTATPDIPNRWLARLQGGRIASPWSRAYPSCREALEALARVLAELT